MLIYVNCLTINFVNKKIKMIKICRKGKKVLPYRKKQSRQKMTNYFASDELFCPLFFLPTIIFTDDELSPTNILTDIFLQTRTFSIF